MSHLVVFWRITRIAALEYSHALGLSYKSPNITEGLHTMLHYDSSPPDERFKQILPLREHMRMRKKGEKVRFIAEVSIVNR